MMVLGTRFWPGRILPIVRKSAGAIGKDGSVRGHPLRATVAALTHRLETTTMTTMSTTPEPARPPACAPVWRSRPSSHWPAPSPPRRCGDGGPPVAIVVLSVILSIVLIATAAVAWRSGNRLAIRINAAALLLNALTTLPVFFVDIDPWVKVGSTVVIVLTVAALVLTLRPEHQPFTVTD